MEKLKEFLEKSFQVKENWALLLNNLINEIPNDEISKERREELKTVIKFYCEIRTIYYSKSILRKDKEKLLNERTKKYPPMNSEFFKILHRFIGIYKYYNRNWAEQSLSIIGKKTIKELSQKVRNIEKENAITQIFDEKNQNYKENLRNNLYKITGLKWNEKSKINRIINKKNISKEDKIELKSLLNKLSIEELKIFDIIFKKKDYKLMKQKGLNDAEKRLGDKNPIKIKKENKNQIISQFKNIFNSQLNAKLKEYHKVNKNYITQDFKIPEDLIKGLDNSDMVKICKLINNNQELKHFFKYLISDTTKSIQKIKEQFDDLGFYISKVLISQKAKTILKDNYKLRFPSGKAKDNPLDKDNLNYNNLMDSKLIQDFKEYHKQSSSNNFYPNTGQILRDDFIQWIKKK